MKETIYRKTRKRLLKWKRSKAYLAQIDNSRHLAGDQAQVGLVRWERALRNYDLLLECVKKHRLLPVLDEKKFCVMAFGRC
jgi:hypothetical protein